MHEIMVQMAIEPFVNVRAMKKLLFRVLPDRKHVDRHMINNVRTRTRRKIASIRFFKYRNSTETL